MIPKNWVPPAEMAKVGYVAQEFGDRHKPHMVHDASSLRVTSIRVILFVAEILDFRLFSHEVTQAYLQSKYMMTQDAYITPKLCDRPLFGPGDGEVLKLRMPLYGIFDAGNYWGVTVNEHTLNYLGTLPAPDDPALYVYKVPRDGIDRPIGITGCHIDDALNDGTHDFETTTEDTLRKFEDKPRKYDWFEFYGTQEKTEGDGAFTFDQKHYAEGLNTVPIYASLDDFRRTRALFSWLVHTRPNLSFLANKAP